MKVSLTDLGIQKLKRGEHFDTKLPAFGIRVGVHRRTWFVMKGHRRQKLTLGTYPALSLAEARRSAHAAIAAPLANKSTITFPEARDAFLALDRWRPGSKRVLICNLRHFPWKGPIARITHEQVRDVLDAIEGKSARAHALKDIRTLFNWCIPRHLSASPAQGIKMEKQPSRDRVLTDDELAAVWRAAGECGQFGVIVKLLILTGQRRSEVGSLERSWIKGDRMTLPATATKNGREHTFHLVSSASCLLASRSTVGCLFPSTSGGPFSAWSKNHAAILKLSGTCGWTLHDLRRTFATGLAALGTPIHVAEKLLNHVSGSLSGVAGIYNRFDYWEEQKVALIAWEERVLSLVR